MKKKENKRIKRDVAFLDVLLSGVTIVGTTIGAAVSFSGFYFPIRAEIRNRETKNNKLKIERNVVENNEIAKFTGSAFTVSKSNSDYFVELFGTAIKTPGATPTFTSLNYKIDKDMYDKAFKYMDISYEYGKDGQIIGAENTLREGLEFGISKVIKARWAEHDLLEQLEVITREKALSINEIGKVTETSDQTLKNANENNLSILNITKPMFNNKTKEVDFFIQALTDVKVNKDDQGKLTVKTFKVSQPVTKEMAKNPSLAFSNYLKGKTDFALEKEEVLTINNLQVSEIQNDWGARKPVVSKSR